MKDKKKEYLAPTVEVKAVEIESSICGGSADITNKQEGENMAIESQKVNDSFDYTPSAGDSNLGGWDSVN